MVVSVIMALISLVIFSTFNNGMKIWQRVQKLSLAEDCDIFLDRFTQDTTNAFYFTGISFKGTSDRLLFPGFVQSQRMNKRTVGQIQYSYDQDVQLLTRSQADYSQALSGEELSVRSQLSNISKCSLRYYVFDPERKVYLWAEEYTPSTVKPVLPRAVRLVLEIKDGANVRWINRTVEIPVGGEPKK
jgi:hypothetical protein